MHEHRKTRAGADEHGLEAVLAHQLVDGHDAADDHVRLDLDTEGLQAVDFLLHDGLRQTELGDTVDQHAAGKVERFKHGDIVALLGKVARTGEAAGAGADDRDLRADAAADSGEGGGLVDDLIGALIVLFGDLLDEFGDLDLHRAAGDAGMVLAV